MSTSSSQSHARPEFSAPAPPHSALIVRSGEAHGAAPEGRRDHWGSRVHQIRCLCGCDLSRLRCGPGAARSTAGWSRRRAWADHAAPGNRQNPARKRPRPAGNTGAKRRGLSGACHRPVRPPGARGSRCALWRHSDGATDRHGAARRLWPATLRAPAGLLRPHADGRDRRLSAGNRDGSTARPGRRACSRKAADPAPETGREARSYCGCAIGVSNRCAHIGGEPCFDDGIRAGRTTGRGARRFTAGGQSARSGAGHPAGRAPRVMFVRA